MAEQSAYDPQSTTRHFDEFGLREWNRLVQTPVDEVSLYIHTHYLEKYLTAGMHVLEIGAGAGRFTQVLAGLGARISVADLSPVQLDLNRQHARQFGFDHAIENWMQVDICAMTSFEAQAFDAVVAYGGPLSYVLDRRTEALAECMRVLKPGGLLLLSVMSVWGTAHRHLNGVLALPPAVNQRITSTGDLTSDTFPGRQGNFMHMFQAAELSNWLTLSGLSILALSASGCLSTGWEHSLGQIRADPEQWSELLRTELEASITPGCSDMGTHLIAVTQTI